MINDRLFGTPIQGEVRKVLEQRQGADVADVVETAPGDPVWNEELQTYMMPETSVTGTQTKPYTTIDKTPFVRMWTSVKLIEPASLVEIAKEDLEFDTTWNLNDPDRDPDDPEYSFLDMMADGAEKILGALTFVADKILSPVPEAKALLKRPGLKTKYPGSVLVPIKENGEIIGYSIRKPTRQVDYVRKIYEVGNNTYQESYGEVNINESLTLYNNELTAEDYQKTFPQELAENKFMKPQAGITSVSSETDGALGVIKKTTVNFVVSNFYDYDRIYNKYFLKPGATVFVDFGNSNIDSLYRPEELLDFKGAGGLQEYLYGETQFGQQEGFITKNEGNVEVIQGLVTDYGAKILPDGTVECSLTLTSSNNALLSFSLDASKVAKIKDILTRGTLYLGLRQVVAEGDPTDVDNDLEQLMSTPDASSGAQTIDSYEKNIKLLAIKQLSGRSGPAGNAIRTGVFVDSLTADNVYVAWGLFEDLIINSEFGFGKDEKEIQEAKGVEVTLNSDTSFTGWTKLYEERTHVLLKTSEDPPVFVYPTKWGKFSDGGSYNYQKGKYPKRDYDIKEQQGFWGSVDDFTEFDKKINGPDGIGRIPLREVFINVETIYSAFEKNSTIQKAIEEILDDINEDSDGFFDWKLIAGKNDAQLKIIDKNYAFGDEVHNKQPEDNSHFTFRVMQPNSIVKDYDLEFKLPDGSLGNMYAIQGMSHGNALFTTNNDVSKAVSIAATDKEALSIIYEPDLGSLRLDQLLDEHNTAQEDTIYDTMNDIFDTNTFNVDVRPAPNLIPDGNTFGFGNAAPLTDENVVGETTTSDVTDEKTSPEELIKKNDRNMEIRGMHVASSFRDYYKIKIVNEAVSKQKPTILPYTLSLTTYGISSIVPGDTFKVDYLPQMYLDTTYLQTTKVIHEVGPGGWFTTLETMFRLMPGLNQDIINVDRKKVRLSALALNKQNFEGEMDALDGWFNDTELKISDLTPYFLDSKIEYLRGGRLDYVIEFKMTDRLNDVLADAYGGISHEDTSFWAYYGVDGVTAGYAPSKHNLGVYTAHTWWDILTGGISSALKTMANFVEGTSQFEGLRFYAGPTGIYHYPPDTILVPGRMYYMLVRGDTYAIVPSGKIGRNYINYFNEYIGDNFNTLFDPYSESNEN